MCQRFALLFVVMVFDFVGCLVWAAGCRLLAACRCGGALVLLRRFPINGVEAESECGVPRGDSG